MCFTISGLHGHGGERDVGHGSAVGGAGREPAVVLKVKGERVRMVIVHVFDDALLRCGVFRCLLRHCDARSERSLVNRIVRAGGVDYIA